jgi:hypothetical protein
VKEKGKYLVGVNNPNQKLKVNETIDAHEGLRGSLLDFLTTPCTPLKEF